MTEKKTGASLNRHGSNPNRGTPKAFTDAVQARFGYIHADLAATAKNRVVTNYFGPDHHTKEARDTFSHNWRLLEGNLWLNPPFDKIEKFAAKFGRECPPRNAFSFLLVPASVGSNWFQRHIAPNCFVLELTDRITFVGETAGFPKDLILAVAGFGIVGRAPWHWDLSKRKAYERSQKRIIAASAAE